MSKRKYVKIKPDLDFMVAPAVVKKVKPNPPKKSKKTPPLPTPPPKPSTNAVIHQGFLLAPQAPPDPPKLEKPLLTLFGSTTNFHIEESKIILNHANELNHSQEYGVKCIVLAGTSGMGKSYTIHRACQMGGYESVQVDFDSKDMADNYCVMSSAVLSRPANGKRIRLVVFDNVELWSKANIDKVIQFLKEQLGNPQGQKKRKNAKRVSMHHNLVIIVTNDYYHKNLFGSLQKVPHKLIKLRGLELTHRRVLAQEYCNIPPVNRDMVNVMKHCAAAVDYDIASLLVKISFSNEVDTSKTAKDKHSNEVFSLATQVLLPTSETTPEEYQSNWNLIGERTLSIMHACYVGATVYPQDRQDAELALDMMCSMSEAFSTYDGMQNLSCGTDNTADDDMGISQDPDDYKEMFIRESCRLTLSQVQKNQIRVHQMPVNNVKPKLVELRNPVLGDYSHVRRMLNACLIDRRQEEALWYINMMRIALVKRHESDYTTSLENNYDLSHYIGKYLTRVDDEHFVVDDIFPRPGSTTDEDGKVMSKKQAEESSQAKMQAIRFFSNTFSTDSYVKGVKSNNPKR